jgi:multimeric flavodoxin WrbA
MGNSHDAAQRARPPFGCERRPREHTLPKENKTMTTALTRRRFLGTAGTAAAASAAGSAALAADSPQPAPRVPIKILGVCCSPRKGQTTAVALQVCLDAAKQVADNVEIELIELAGLKIPGCVAADVPLEPGEQDDFPALLPRLTDPKVAGIIIGTPVYFGNMSALCKAFLDRCIVLRKDFPLSGKVGGVLAVGAARNGGQELTIASVQAVLFCHEMLLVGDGKPTSHRGATLWSGCPGGIEKDEFGLSTAKNLGRRVAEVALRVHAVKQ